MHVLGSEASLVGFIPSLFVWRDDLVDISFGPILYESIGVQTMQDIYYEERSGRKMLLFLRVLPWDAARDIWGT